MRRERDNSAIASDQRVAPTLRLAAVGGLVGAAALVASFLILPKPPELGASLRALVAYAHAHHALLLWAAWLEGTGSLLYVVFLVALAVSASLERRLSTVLTIVAATTVLVISLVYDVALIAIAQSAATGGPQLTTGTVAYGIFAATEHAFLIAPSVFLPLGFASLGARVIPLSMSRLAIALGCASECLGLIGLFYARPNNGGAAGVAINVLVGIEALWTAAAACLVLRRGRIERREHPAACRIG